MAEVRAARDADVAAICDICERAYPATYTGLVSSDYLDRMLAEFYQPDRVAKAIAPAPPDWLGYQVVEEQSQVVEEQSQVIEEQSQVIEEQSRVVGVAAGGITSPGSGELFMLYLEPGERGRGLGTLLLDRVTEQLRELGATEMWVAALEGNKLGLPFYEARGFVRQSRRKAYGTTDAEDYWSLLLRRPI
ncbi:GNAT family N-acetyltransferase [Actinoplanes sp. GCM10030250]|uniref:GNAT family N-acetyltransferase n=1 Tax=Actinoplanes sp. GCM10030250 TaxID=3273376 RepID=UPI003616E893